MMYLGNQPVGINEIITQDSYIVTPQMFGAKADGTTDDTLAIQAALDTRQKVYFPNGNYKITSPLTLYYGSTVEGGSKYTTVIWAYGCDCFQLTAGDQGERGAISNIHLRGNYTAGSKGIKISALAPGWTIENVWINSFDYGIWGTTYNINNIYIDKCIITGKSDKSMTAGIFMPNAYNNQINAITIRDTEINMFKTGIRINGTAIMISGCTIQTIDNGIEITCEGHTTGLSCITYGCTITGCYMEGINKSAIYCDTSYDDNGTIKNGGFITGLQITGNYLYKNGGDQNYAVIRFVKSPMYGDRAIDMGCSNGTDYANVFIGMNLLSQSGNTKYYDIAHCLSSDSVFMQSFAGGTSYNNTLKNQLGDLKTGARMITGNHIIKEKLQWWETKYKINSHAELTDDETITLHPGGVLRIHLDVGTVGWDLPLAASAYPANRYITARGKKASDGLMYGLSSQGFSTNPDTTDLETLAQAASNGIINSVGTDGYYHWQMPAMYFPYSISHNSYACLEALIISPGNKENDIYVKAPTIERLV